MRIRRNHYEVFGLPHTASQMEIRGRFLELVRKFHPDRSKDRVTAERLFTQINVAHQTLRDPALRAEYDRSVSGRAAKPSTRAAADPAQHAGPAPAEPAGMHPDEALRQAQAAHLNGDRTEAARCCAELLKGRPEDAVGQHLHGDILADQGKRAEALAAYRHALALDPKSRLLQGKVQRTTDAIAVAEKIAASKPAPKPASKSKEPAARIGKRPAFPFARR